MTLHVFIADDDHLAREQIRYLLAAQAGVHVVREFSTGWETVRAVQEEKPDILFLDVQMPDLDGFGVLKELSSNGIPEVVFVTAYDQYALKAFEVRASDYLMKPVDPHRFHETFEKVRRRIESQRETEADSRLLSVNPASEGKLDHPQRLAVPSGDRILFLPLDGVFSVEAAGNYVRIHTSSGSYLRRDTLANMARLLDPERFLRVHRCWLVNVDRIRELIPWFHRTFILVMENDHRIQVSRSFRGSIESLLGKHPRQLRRQVTA